MTLMMQCATGISQSGAETSGAQNGGAKTAATICHVPNTKDWRVEAARQFSYALYTRSTPLIVETEPQQPWLKAPCGHRELSMVLLE